MKFCSKCKTEKDLSSFFKDSANKDLLRPYCKDCDKSKNAKWRSANHEKHNAMAREWNRTNKDICIKRATAWNKSHPEYRRAITKMRKKHIKLATPAWADINKIIEFYKNTPTGYHVDHIIPLHGENVSGLHVLENLQYLPAKENLKKSNKVD